MKTFSDKVYAVVKNIKRGKTLTYKQVANLVGSPKAYRAVGNILNKNYNQNIPCHRVTRSDGAPGGYNRGRKLKVQRLKEEGARL
ncbi:MAG: methylated-DNA-[protein]-cysteine S-methyltransferase [Patescibacteria group bacterium]|nr:methylated-DNA-[protein]-cysteine S-methyltransferase [Patescibacteria group bacterium]